jgi:alpha-amylase
MTFQRVLGNERAVVAINYGSSAATIAVGGLPPGAVLNAGYPAGAGSLTAGGSGIVRVSLPAQSFLVYWNRS